MPLRRKLFWVAILYFAQGFPAGIVKRTLNNYFAYEGVPKPLVGLLSAIGVVWSYKVFWAPVVERVGSFRIWISGCLVGIAILTAAVPSFPIRDADPGILLFLVAAAIASLSATQDIAIDGYTIGLMAKGEEGAANSIRVAAYRAALIVTGGALVAAAGVPWFGWAGSFRVGAAALVVCAILALFLPPVARAPCPPGQWFRTLLPWVRDPKGIAMLLFVLLYKLGDQAMGPMVSLFWVDQGMSPAQMGLFNNTLGMLAAVAGAALGGILVTRNGILWGLWILGLFQAYSNLGYAAAARFEWGWYFHDGMAMYSVGVFENFSAGLGVASFLSFLMNVCDKEHAVTQFALLTAIMGLGEALVGWLGGIAADRLSYESFFLFTFVLALPAFALIPFVKGWIREAPRGEPGAAAPL